MRLILSVSYQSFPCRLRQTVTQIIKKDERDGLLQLRDSVTSDANLHSNWTGPPCISNDSKWIGIACSDGHVVHIVLEGIQLSGSLPPTFLLNITFLAILSFRNNTISGPLPDLTNLVHLEHAFFSQNRFWGSIPLEYAELPKLKAMELQENYLDGNIPPFDQPSLTIFNVSYNHLEGPIPNTDALQRFPSSSYDHNSGLCGSPLKKPCPFPPPPPPDVSPSPLPTPVNPEKEKKKPLRLWSIVLIASAASLVPVIVILFSLCYYRMMHRKEKTTENQAEIEIAARSESIDDFQRRQQELEFFDKQISAFDLDDLLRASAEVLGKGKLGTTYKTVLESGTTVAVKRLKNMSGLSKKEFVQQMQLLGSLRHENLVQIISFYYSKEEKLIISEFVPNGSLFELLHENRGVGRVPLKWETRLSIIKDIAKGLAFLHQSLPSHKVPHANLKSSNVVIQQNFHSKLSNFGFLPLLPSRKSSEALAIAKSPEFAQGKKLSNKADVYCFGIILLEIITGRIPGEISRVDDDDTTEDLSDWVRMVVNTDWSTDILDMEILAAKEGHEEMLKLTEIALECTDLLPEKRPKMPQVLQRIEEIIEQKRREND
ncbi:probable leucine-rich repeat receptor-like protein kinase At1g68400 isoform X2 [Ziziphus jujuba]|uniref:Probable leucine-rich repeat receptor-like protein kinase At1g68400 isoform X2 n=1 Tax=Ziziphus jujuba TaxID=326968 RepID=A0A6P4A6P5_ZIZJJ|nr:probable leucine-rich repeat receptor-like protein kinase At1g68400 isoform X2 [Ziziphus jujuba]